MQYPPYRLVDYYFCGAGYGYCVKTPNQVEKTNFLKTYEEVRLTLGKHIISSEKDVSGKFGLSSHKSGKFVLSSQNTLAA